ncbi:tRNA 2-selenouridine synthase, partial [Helicobacter valdiviensis]
MWDRMQAAKKKFPQVLFNGCKYYRNDHNYDVNDPDYEFNFKDKPEFAYYEDQFRAYMGEETYKKLRPYLLLRT